MMKYDIITIGDVSEDIFIRPAELKVADSRSVLSGRVISFELGEKIPIEDVNYDIGGSAANVAVGLSRTGFRTGVVSAIGDDSPAEKIRLRFEEEGLGRENLHVDKKNKTNFAVIINTKDGERTILVYHGIDYPGLKIKNGVETDWIFLAPVGKDSDNIIKQILAQTAEKNVKLAWNPGSYQIKTGTAHFSHLLLNTSVLFLNREEARKFLSFPVRPKDEEIMKKLHLLGAKIVIVTDSQNGAKAYDGNVFYRIDIIKNIKRVDATGAGDSFATGFLARLLFASKNNHSKTRRLSRNLSRFGSSGKTDGAGTIEYDKELISEALKYGIVNSTSVVSQIGAEQGLLSISEIEREISKYPRLQAEVYS